MGHQLPFTVHYSPESSLDLDVSFRKNLGVNNIKNGETGMPRPAALHAAFTCCRPSLPGAFGFCTWVRRARCSAWPVEAPCFPSRLPIFVFQAERFFREGLRAAVLCKFAREIGRQVVSRFPGGVGLRRWSTPLKGKEIRRGIK